MGGLPKDQMLKWDDNQVALLIRLARENNTANQIAEAIGPPCTRNSVLGKAKRLKIILKPATKNNISAKLPFKPVQTTLIRNLPHGVPIEQTSRFGCKWIDDNRLYCNDPVDWKSYCKNHAALVYLRKEN